LERPQREIVAAYQSDGEETPHRRLWPRATPPSISTFIAAKLSLDATCRRCPSRSSGRDLSGYRVRGCTTHLRWAAIERTDTAGNSLTEISDPSRSETSNPSWAPNGRLLFVDHIPTSRAAISSAATRDGGFEPANIAGGNLGLLHPSVPSWRSLLVTNPGSSDLWRVATSAPAAGASPSRPGTPDWSPMLQERRLPRP